MRGTGRKAIDNTAVVQPEVRIHRTLDTLPVFVRAGAIVPEQPLVQSTDEKPEGRSRCASILRRRSATNAAGRSTWTMASATTSKRAHFLRDEIHLQAECAGLAF